MNTRYDQDTGDQGDILLEYTLIQNKKYICISFGTETTGVGVMTQESDFQEETGEPEEIIRLKLPNGGNREIFAYADLMMEQTTSE